MEENVFDKMPGLEKFLETKSFSELTGREREEVLRHIGQDEYDAYREIILESKNRFAQEQKTNVPDPAIHGRLLAEMDKKTSRRSSVPGLLQKLFTYRIPFYQPAFAVAVLVVLFLALQDRSTDTIRYLARTDTVYIEKQIPAVETGKELSLQRLKEPLANTGNLPGKPATLTQTYTGTNEANASHSAHDQYIENAYEKIHLATQFKRGQTASDDSALIRFLVTAN